MSGGSSNACLVCGFGPCDKLCYLHMKTYCLCPNCGKLLIKEIGTCIDCMEKFGFCHRCRKPNIKPGPKRNDGSQICAECYVELMPLWGSGSVVSVGKTLSTWENSHQSSINCHSQRVSNNNEKRRRMAVLNRRNAEHVWVKNLEKTILQISDESECVPDWLFVIRFPCGVIAMEKSLIGSLSVCLQGEHSNFNNVVDFHVEDFVVDRKMKLVLVDRARNKGKLVDVMFNVFRWINKEILNDEKRAGILDEIHGLDDDDPRLHFGEGRGLLVSENAGSALVELFSKVRDACCNTPSRKELVKNRVLCKNLAELFGDETLINGD